MDNYFYIFLIFRNKNSDFLVKIYLKIKFFKVSISLFENTIYSLVIYINESIRLKIYLA